MKHFPVFLASFGFAAAVHSVHAQIIISEVMYNPRGSEQANEFVELYNLGARDAISLAGWKIGERGALDEIISHNAGLVLQPQQYALILDPTYFQTSTQYDSLIARAALVVTIEDLTLGNGGLSNSTAETIVLLNAEGDTVAQYTYSLGNGDGVSDEKIELNEDDAAQNWANALRVDGTPGFANSVARAQIDGALVAQSLTITPLPLRENTSASISVLLRNTGREALTSVSVDFDLIPRGREFGAPIYLGNLVESQTLANNDTLRVHFNAPPMPAGRYHLLATLAVANDVNARNDTVSIPLAVGWRRELIVINEIMFEPASGQPEWVEIFNPQSFSVPLTDWLVEDESASKGAITQALFIPPRGYRVLTASRELAGLFHLPDTAIILLNKFPSLNNSGDAVLLRDFSGGVIDSIFYEGDWGRPGKAIEKIWHERGNSQRNWLPSIAAKGATPAAFNSVSPREYDLEIRELRSVPPRSQFGAEVQLEAVVVNHGRRVAMNFSTRFSATPFATSNEMLLGEVVVNQNLQPEDSLLVTLERSQPPPGRHTIQVEVKDAHDVVAENNRAAATLWAGYPAKSVVINEIYASPRSNEIEWVELFNRSSYHVDLSQWQWRDAEAAAPALFPDSSATLAPGEYAVVSPPGSLPVLDRSALHLQISKWLTLNNDGERLRLCDFSGGGQDSVSFRSAWGGGAGVSLERINPNLTSQDSANWSSCVDPTGATAGRQNSIFTGIVPQTAEIAVAPNPFSPDGDGRDDFTIFQLKVPVTTAAVHLKIYDLRGRLIRELLNNRNIGSHFETVWNGHDDQGQPVRTGLYIVHLRAIRAEQGVLISSKITVTVVRNFN